jgi:hypothetical protein
MQVHCIYEKSGRGKMLETGPLETRFVYSILVVRIGIMKRIAQLLDARSA